MERPVPERAEGLGLRRRVRRVRLAPGLPSELLRLARAAAPREACALVFGDLEGDLVLVDGARPAPNLATDPGAFLVDPVAQLCAEREAAGTGQRLLGAWHSHPGGTREPSRSDVAGAAYPLVLVTALEHGGAELVAWWVAEGVPVRLLVVESGPAAFSGGARRPKG